MWQARLAATFGEGLGAIKHRGPDDTGTRVIGGLPGGRILALGHQRLSVLDLSSAGRQPMLDSRGRVAVYNGEIFNWLEIRQQLQGDGYSFSTRSDTEVLLAAWDRWGTDCVRHFNGFWAFAIFDPSPRDGGPVLALCRDRFGIKPLYLCIDDQITGFGSEIRPLLTACDKPMRVDPDSLMQQLIYEMQPNSPQTLFENVEEVAPATWRICHLSERRWVTREYWSPGATPLRPRSDSQALEEFSWLLEDAVSMRLRADVEVALTLSGGVDSSAIAAAIRSNRHEAVKAFTSRFRNSPQLDETRWAAAVCRRTGMDHILVDVEEIDLDREERLLSRHIETIYTSFSQLVNWQVIKAIREQSAIKVFLNGQGGDEVFLGYERYYVPHIRSRGLWRPSGWHELIQCARHSGRGFAELLGFLAYFSGKSLRQWRYRRSASALFQPWLLEAPSRIQVDSLPEDKRELTIQETCGPQLQRLLRFDDRISAAFGIEGRPVFLDHRIVEFGISLEGHHKIRNGWTKHIVRRYLDSKGLPEVAWRKAKLGFPAPSAVWANDLLKKRVEAIRNSEFMRSVIRAGADPLELTHRQVMALILLHSVSSELNWQPLAGQPQSPAPA